MSGYRQGPDWCMNKPELFDNMPGNVRYNKIPFHRCPKCKRRLQLKLIDTSGFGEMALMYPAHKIRKTKRK